MSSNAIANISSAELAQGTTFTSRQVDLIRDQIMPKATDDELMLFIQVASSRGLDPFRKHIHAVSRRSKDGNNWVDKWSYQVSIDGLRLIAQRSGRYDGQTPPQWCGPDGVWKEVWLAEEPPAAARVGVYIKGNREPLVAIALYRTFVQKYKPQGSSEQVPTKFWADMPEHMLAKCAESQALRKAFPEEAGGLYTPEEMGQSGNPIQVPTDVIDVHTGEIVAPRQAVASVSDPDRDEAKTALWSLAHGTYGWSKDTLNQVAINECDKALDRMSAVELKDLTIKLSTANEQQRDEIVSKATAVEAMPLAGV